MGIKSALIGVLPVPLAARLRRARGRFAARRRRSSPPPATRPNPEKSAKVEISNDSKARAQKKKLADIARLESEQVIEGTVLYESFGGNGALCNPRSLFEHLVTDPEFSDLAHIWVLGDGPEHDDFRARCARLPNVEFVKRGTLEYFRCLRVAQYVITNSAFPFEYIKPKGQVYVNTWHGVPLKRMGYDLPRGAFGARNVIRNLLSADFLLSAGPSMTQSLYKDAFRLDGLYQGTVIETGQPRLGDQASADPEAVRSRLRRRGLAVNEGSGLVLFAPTWRGETTRRPEADVEELRSVVATLREAVGQDFDVLLKVHQLVFKMGADDPELADVLVPNDFNTNELLASVDLLVTDYSSIFFDFLAEDRPIIFYVPDRALYEGGRGLYYSLDSLPGEVADDSGQLADAVKRAAQGAETASTVRRRSEWAAMHAPFADPSITQRIVDVVFRKQSDGVRLVSLHSPERARVLVRAGTVKDADTASDVVRAVNEADPSRNDVTLSYSHSTTEGNAEMLRSLDRSCRLLPAAGAMVATADERALYAKARKAMNQQSSTEGLFSEAECEALNRMTSREWTRLFGDVVFDKVIDLKQGPLPPEVHSEQFYSTDPEETA